MDFEVKKPIPLSIPMVMDFGATNTTAGVYLDKLYFEKIRFHDGKRGLRLNDTNYTPFYDVTVNWQETTLLPSVVEVLSLEFGESEFLFGYEVLRLTDSSSIDEGFWVFYDIKCWIDD
ncbi:hypothetical protein ADH76_11595 [Enterocloster clostridioformis]|uniref:hypothetical protein n=1 Tax=Enterocloster clostridioformis TaxID=1531 RepID=UPI00080C5302|nr:hypothetical protein [Enterocloster clostridioformis]ANU48245.1 hypothetical protein A4V08_23015 [Lachnoclostridium sp. YL32]NDO29507.1 hypothetical protein [Enterocloster clostridioformis]OXE69047.1 hypothetical protein ADH76_11595 [Enterocloster clostridioformis]QQR02869.1 hypothetical protein I5Q83_11800 [Enterocloster clostridioformis]